jgi:hypothetical protein
MKKLLLQPVRLGLLMLLVLAAVGAAPGTAAPITETITGTATGKTIPLGNGTFRIVGTFTDPSTPGVAGTYVGTYVETTTGYITCPIAGVGAGACGPIDSGNHRCNLVEGSVTIRSRGESSTLLIGGDWLSQGRFLSAVCRNRINPEIHDVFLYLTGVDSAFDIIATGSMLGTSTPAQGGIYEDAFSLFVRPCTCT